MGNVFKIEGDADFCNKILNSASLAIQKLYKLHNNLPLSRYYVQNIIGAPLYDPHIPPEHLATTEPVTNCLKETVGVENNVVYIIRDGRH